MRGKNVSVGPIKIKRTEDEYSTEGSCFIEAEAEVLVPNDHGGYTIQRIKSGGVLVGAGSAGDGGYIKEIEAEEVSNLRQQLRVLGLKSHKGNRTKGERIL